MTLLFTLNSSIALRHGLTVGLAVCVFCFVFFIIVRLIAKNSKVVVQERVKDGKSNDEKKIVLVLSSLLERFAPEIEDHEQAGERLISNAREVGRIGLSYWSATAALGIAITAMGLVIAMVTAMAAINQVNRIDIQNSLIEQQIYEAQASRVSSLFSAQLPDLIAAIDLERSGQDEWVPSNLLVSRIQAIVDVAEPYLIDHEVEQIRQRLHHNLSLADLKTGTWFNRTYTIEPLLSKEPLTFSPERGQLLRIILSSGIQLSELEQPLNFSRAYLRGASLSGTSSLGETDLSLANLLDSRIAVDLGSVNLTGAFLPPLDSLYWRLPLPKNELSEELGTQFPKVDYAVTWDTLLARVNFLLELPLEAGTFNSFSGYEPGARSALDMSGLLTLQDLSE
ncbi:pentapeptide repeat-containing protein [Roseobacter sp.]|uniref:pentapeptide repeat-containing protein n=1 Tax=Roseobacter sp. TaxID=1907202 RepID=UPI00385A24BE